MDPKVLRRSQQQASLTIPESMGTSSVPFRSVVATRKELGALNLGFDSPRRGHGKTDDT